MEENSIFKIPTSSSVADIQKAKIDAVDISSAPIKIQTQNNNSFNLYDELTAISEEVIACRNTALRRA